MDGLCSLSERPIQSSPWGQFHLSDSMHDQRFGLPLTTRHLLLFHWIVPKSFMPEYPWKDTQGPGPAAASREGRQEAPDRGGRGVCFSQNTLLFLLNLMPCAVICLFLLQLCKYKKSLPGSVYIYLVNRTSGMGQKELPVSLGGLGMAVEWGQCS